MDHPIIITSQNTVGHRDNIPPYRGIVNLYAPLQVSKLFMAKEDWEDIIKWDK